MTDPHWPFPSLQHPLTPPIAPKYSDYAIKRARPFGIVLKVATENKTEVVPEEALL